MTLAELLDGVGAFSAELDPLVDAETEILYDTGAVINALPSLAGAVGLCAKYKNFAAKLGI